MEEQLSQNNVREHKIITKKKKTHFFETYILKILKQTTPEHSITANAKQQLNSAICYLATEITKIALYLTQKAKKKTLSEKEVLQAVKILFPTELSTNAVFEGERSILKFTNEDRKNASRQDKAGIIFPPSITEKFLRNFDYSNYMVTKKAPIFLAAVLEYLTQDILQLSAEIANDNNRVRITIRDLELSVRMDPELSILFTKCNIAFIGGGVVPFIHSSLLSKKPQKKNAINPPKKNRRFRPGTVAIREIKKYQKLSNCIIFSKLPFEKYTRQIVSRYNDKIKISKHLFIVLQYYIESYIIEILKDANKISNHCKRVKVIPEDINLVCELRKEGISKEISENESS